MEKKTSYVAKDGSEHTTEYKCREYEARIAGYCWQCPACKTRGTEDGEEIWQSRYDKEATAWGGQFASDVYKKVLVGHKQVPCSVCNGVGWTADEKEPIMSDEVTGWRDKGG